MRENDFLQWIQQHAQADARRVPVGIGDDMAVVRLDGPPLALLKIDQCLDQVHFDLRHHSAAQAGTKAVNRCLSDCAGMACVPAAIMISVALPKTGAGSGEAFARELFLACKAAAARFDCALVGGDTGMWEGRLAVTVAALGVLSSGAPVPVLRSGAKRGDTLFVSGRLGGSILGRHLDFEPRIELAQQLARALGTGPAGGLHALMDLSDGLAQDLPRLCAASGTGAQVHSGRLPIHADAETLSSRDHLPAGLHALADGEDYELLLAVDTERIPDLIPISEGGAVPLTAIGVVTAEQTLALVDEAGRSHPWPRVGWEHRSGG
jgi:thiamine-monophosphate kinase